MESVVELFESLLNWVPQNKLSQPTLFLDKGNLNLVPIQDRQMVVSLNEQVCIFGSKFDLALFLLFYIASQVFSLVYSGTQRLIWSEKLARVGLGRLVFILRVWLGLELS